MVNNPPHDFDEPHTMSGYTGVDNRSTNIAIYGLIFVIMVSVGRIQEIIPGLFALKLGKVAFGLSLILYILSPKRSDIKFLATPQMKYLSALFLLGLVSIPFSFWPTKSLNFMVYVLFPTFVLVFIVIKVVITYSDTKKVVWGIVVSITLLSIIAILAGGNRIAASSTYDPNDLALVLLLFLPLFYFMMKNEQGILRLILASASIISIAAIMATQSRGGFIGLVTVLLGIVIKERFSFIKLLILGSTLFFAFNVFAPEGYGERISSIFIAEKDYNRTAQGGRVEIWKRGLEIIVENPLVGVGPSVFDLAEGATHEEHGISGRWMTAHNSFIQIGAELGLAGLVFFVMILVSSIRSLRSTLKELPADSELCWLINSLEIGFYGFITTGFFLSQAYSAALYLLVGLTIAVVRQAEVSLKLQNRLSTLYDI